MCWRSNKERVFISADQKIKIYAIWGYPQVTFMKIQITDRDLLLLWYNLLAKVVTLMILRSVLCHQCEKTLNKKEEEEERRHMVAAAKTWNTYGNLTFTWHATRYTNSTKGISSKAHTYVCVEKWIQSVFKVVLQGKWLFCANGWSVFFFLATLVNI